MGQQVKIFVVLTIQQQFEESDQIQAKQLGSPN